MRTTKYLVPLAGVSLVVLALLLPGLADAKRKSYEGKLYNGKPIEEYCSDLLNIEAFELSDDDLATCDKQYRDQVDSLEDVSLDDIQLSGSSMGENSGADREKEREDEGPKLSRKEEEEQRLAAEAAEQERLARLGIVDFGEEAGDEAASDDEEEDDDLDEDLDEPGFDDEEEVDVFDDSDEVMVEDFDDEGGHDSGLEDLDFDDEDSGDNTKKKKKKKKKKKGSSSAIDFDDSMDIPE